MSRQFLRSAKDQMEHAKILAEEIPKNELFKLINDAGDKGKFCCRTFEYIYTVTKNKKLLENMGYRVLLAYYDTVNQKYVAGEKEGEYKYSLVYWGPEKTPDIDKLMRS